MSIITHTPRDAASRIVAAWQSATGQPVCPVVVGDAGSCVSAIHECFPDSVSNLEDPDISEFLLAWCRTSHASHELIEGLVAFLAQRSGRNASQLRKNLPGASDFFIRKLLRDACINSDSTAGQLVFAIRKHGPRPDAKAAERIAQDIAELVADRPSGPDAVTSVFRTLLDFLPPSSHPIFVCSFNDLALARAIQSVVFAEPQLRVVFVFSRKQHATLREQPDSYSRAAFEQLVIDLTTPSENSETATTQDVTNDFARQWPECLRSLLNSDELIRAAKHQVQSAAKVVDEPSAENARSAAEAFLFQVICAHPQIEHEFELNRMESFRFGSRNAEIDLACVELKIAIEVDGYFHFRDDESYRRDRRKDALLQTHGYHVLRFLAADVVPAIDVVLQTIVSAISYRKRQSNTLCPGSSRKPK